MEKRTKSFDGISINYSIKRISKKFLIFLHGAGGDLNVWKDYVRFFNNRDFSTLAIDLRGHGYSGKPKNFKDYSIEKSARDINLIIKKEKINDFVLVGHCYGGMVALTFNRIYPNLAKGNIIISSSYKSPNFFKKHIFINKIIFLTYKVLYVSFKNTGILKKHYHGKYDSSFANGDFFSFKRFINDFGKASLEEIFHFYENSLNYDESLKIKSINKPVLIIIGKRDIFFNVKDAEDMRKKIKNSELRIINANHWPVFNKKKEIKNSILEFLRNNSMNSV